MADAKPNRLSTNTSRRFVRLAWTLGIGVPLGLAPLLGTDLIPGFEPLLTVLSQDLRAQVVPYSILLVSLIALGLEFYVRERITRRVLRWVFPLGLLVLVIAVGALLGLQTRHIRLVPIEGGTSSRAFVVSSPRLSTCGCGTLGDIACLQSLSFDPAAIESCWSGPDLEGIRLRLMGTYLLVIGGFLVLVGVLVLQPQSRSPRGGGPARKRGQRRAPQSSTAAPEPAAPDDAKAQPRTLI